MDMTRYIGKPIAMLLGLGTSVGRTMAELSDRFAIIAKNAAAVPD